MEKSPRIDKENRAIMDKFGEKNKRLPLGTGSGMVLGALFGMILGLLVEDLNIALGMAFGMCIGLIVGSISDAMKKK